MRHLTEDFDDFDFSDSDLVARIMREQDREERALAHKHRRKHSNRHWSENGARDDNRFSFVSDDEFEEYEEYDDEEFDSFSGVTEYR